MVVSVCTKVPQKLVRHWNQGLFYRAAGGQVRFL